jgi:hypothetical protein
VSFSFIKEIALPRRLPTEYFAAKEKPSSLMSALNVKKKKEQVRNTGDLGQLGEAF